MRYRNEQKPLSLLTRIIVWLFWRHWKAGQ